MSGCLTRRWLLGAIMATGGAFTVVPHSLALAGTIEQAMKSVGTVLASNGQGTGFVVDRPTLLVTNYHVVADADDAMVTFPDGSEILVKGFLLASPEHDLVLLELEKPAPAQPLGLCEENPDVGTDVFAIGAPRGLNGSVSKGIVSAYRKWPDLASFFGPIHQRFGYADTSKWVQTDAAINHGNSGGPLILEGGKVLAVNTLGSLPGVDQNINFAIDIIHVRNAIQRLPDTSRPLTDLPRRPRPAAPPGQPPADEADRTLAYWSRMAQTLGTYIAEDTKMRAKAFGHANPDAPLRARDGRPVGLDDHLFGKTVKDREKRIRKWAVEAGISYEEALTMDFHSLSLRKDDRRMQAEGERRDRVRQNNLGPGLLQAEKARQAKQGTATMKRKFDDIGRGTSKLARKAAQDLDALPTAGINPGLVTFVIEVKSSLHRIAVKCDRMHGLAEHAIRNDPGSEALFRDALEASREMNEAMAQLHELVEVSGSALKSKLGQFYGKDFSPVVQVTEEQGKVLGIK